MSSRKAVKGVFPGKGPAFTFNSLDWDSPSTKTGTVKRRPVSGDSLSDKNDGNNSPEGRSKGQDPETPSRISAGDISKDFGMSKIPKASGLAKPQLTFATFKRSVLDFKRDQRNHLEVSKEGERVCRESSDRHAYYTSELGKTGKLSDSDSGIASPLSPSSGYGFLGYDEIDGHKERMKMLCLRETVQIYTDWANHYLEKARSKKRVNSLAADCSDGVLLAEVIESVTCQKIPDINRKPKTPSQMIIKLKRVLFQPVNQTFFRKENNIIPFEITCLNGSTIELLGKHISDHTLEQVTPTTIENCADFKGKLKITGFIKVVFKRLSGNFNSFGSGAIVNGNYKLRVHIANFQEENNLLSTEGAHISIVGEIQKDKYDSIYFQVNETDDITKLDDQLLSTEQLKKGIYTPMKRKFSDDATEAGCSPNKRPNSVSSLLELDNINLCLGVLKAQHVAGLENVSAQELRDGKLKAILALFFALSRHKQAAKQRAQQIQQNQLGEMTPNRSSAIPHKGGSSIPLPGSALPSRRCPPDKVRPVAGSSRATSPSLSMIPRGPATGPTAISSPYQAATAPQKNSMLDKLKLFKSNDRPTPVTNGKRTSSSSGVSSARSERSDSSASLEPNLEVKPVRNASRLKQTRPTKAPSKNSPNSIKKDVVLAAKPTKIATEVEKHAHKVASLPTTKLTEPKIKLANKSECNKVVQGQNHLPTQNHGTGIPKPTAAIKGTSKIVREEKSFNSLKMPPTSISRENSQTNINHKPAALVSPMKNEKENQLSESSNSVSTGQQSNSSDSVIYKLSSESSSDPNPPVRNISETKDDEILEKITNLNGFVKEHQPEEETPLSIEPMRPLLRGYCNTLTLPSRQRQYQRVPDPASDYCEISLANGYLSDGEVLRNPPQRDIQDGYMSESGSILYARRLQTMPAHIPNGTPRISPGLTVLTEQASRRGRVEEPPPPPAPRVTSRSSRNGVALQDAKHGQWKRYTDSPGVGSPPPPAPAPSSPTSGRRERRSSPHGGKEKSSKVRGVPQSFGYVKRSSSTSNGTNGTPNGTAPQMQVLQTQGGKTAAVSAVPRTKVKVSGGTQTCSSDLQQSHKSNTPQFKSYSLTGNTASQLSQSVRERLMMGSQSLPKGAGQDYGLVLRQGRPKASDGSLSDTQAIENTSPYAPWLRHSNTYSVAPRLSETDSMESLTSLPGHRSSLTHTRLLRDSPSRLSRSNSIRSTKSEKLYPSMLHRNTEPETEPYYCLPIGALSHWSQPTSPAPGSSTRSFPLSPTHSSTPRHSIPKNDDVHGSSISLVSTASSLYSSAEEKQAHEIRKLRRELIEAQEKVQTLTSQLSTNAHVVSAFEQSLSSMTQRLQHLTATAEKKDSELAELKSAMEALRAQSLQAGIGTGLARQPSSDSVSSLSSACSLDKHEKKKKKGWLRSSFTKAFSRNAKVTKVQCQSEGENERQNSPPPPAPADAGQEVAELQKQLREKDLVLTDIRLEALSSAHQLESLKDTVMKMRSEMLSLKQNNERLQRMVNGATNLPADLTETRSTSSVDALSDLIPTEEPPPEPEQDGKRVTISVYLGQPHSFEKYYIEHYTYDGMCDSTLTEIAIAHTNIGASCSWAQLDNTVRRAFKQHVARLDPGGGLGLGSDSIASYKLGEAERKPDSGPPDLLPVGYAVGRVCTIHVVLQPVAALAFEALIPKGVAQRLVSLLAEHRRLVLCGAPGTGKTHLATRLAEFHAQSQGRDPAEAVATFNVDNKSGKELRQYLAHLSEQAAAGDNNVLPCVVVLDNLHKAGPLADALGALPRNLPCLLGTMAQSACSATSLQLQHGFRWVLVAPHMEPARGLLGRVLRRRLASLELEQGPKPELAAILGWLPRVWQHLNAFLETHSSGDVAIGPRLFLSCPLELDAARAWFADVWNYSLAPYLREAAREGLQLYGRRAPWTDPAQFVVDTYPWPGAPPQGLTGITAKDVGLESGPATETENEGDPLLNMLMRLQEAANYSSPHSNDSDCNSLESNLTHGSSVGTESVS